MASPDFYGLLQTIGLLGYEEAKPPPLHLKCWTEPPEDGWCGPGWLILCLFAGHLIFLHIYLGQSEAALFKKFHKKPFTLYQAVNSFLTHENSLAV